MAIKTKKINPSINPTDRAVTFTDSDFEANDILDIEASLGRAATFVNITCASDAAVTVRFNSYTKVHPLHPDAKRLGASWPDVSVTHTITDTNAFTFVADNSDDVDFTHLRVRNIEIVSVTAGSGVSIQAH